HGRRVVASIVDLPRADIGPIIVFGGLRYCPTRGAVLADGPRLEARALVRGGIVDIDRAGVEPGVGVYHLPGIGTADGVDGDRRRDDPGHAGGAILATSRW